MGGVTKSALRKQVLHYRRLLGDHAYQQRNQQLTKKLKQLIQERQPKELHLFLAMPKNREPDCSSLFEWLWEKHVRIITSRTHFKEKSMTHHLLTRETPIVLSEKGIPEPVVSEEVSLESLEMVMVPLLLFDRMGQRIGYGGGFYDRMLPTLPDRTLKVGFSLASGVDKFSFVDSHDVPLDMVLTPFETIHCHEN